MTLLNALVLLLCCSHALADPWYQNVWADPLEKRRNVMAGNNVQTTFYNTGLLGRVGAEFSFEWPLGTGDEYIGDFGMILGSSVHNPLLVRNVNSVAVTQSPARGRDEVNPANPAEYWTFMPLPGLAAPETTRVALSSQPFTWPAIWPDTGLGGWNSGLADGALPAAEEGYFWLDDSRDREFLAQTDWAYRDDVDHDLWLHYFPSDPESAEVSLIQPFSNDLDHGGLGLKMGVRTFAWAQPALQDVLFLTYDIHNTGSLELEQSRIGLVVGTIVGGDGDSGDDINWYWRSQNLALSGDGDDAGVMGWEPVLPGVRNVGYVGFALVESPGDGADWIDNDGDAPPGLPLLDEATLESMLSPRTLSQGEVVVLIDYADSGGARPRRLVRVPGAGEPITIRHRGLTLTCAAGQSVQELPDNRVDDNFNGLVDEGGHQLGRAYLNWSELGLPLPAPGEMVDVPEALVQEHAPQLDERQDDGLDNDGDWSLLDDLGADARADTGDEGEGDGQPTAGESHFEQRDPDEADQLGLTGFDEFHFPEFSSRNDEDLWARMTPQVFDSTAGGVPDDTDFLMSCGSFPLPVGRRTRLSVAVIFAVDFENMLQRVEEVQRFYDSEFTELSTPVEPRDDAARPGRISLTNPWPNPFNPVTTVAYRLPAAGLVRLRLYDSAGRLVREVVDGVLPAGEHVARVDGTALASGLYFLRLEALGQQAVRKCLLLK